MLSKLTIEEQFKLCFIYLPNPPDMYIDIIISKFRFSKEKFTRLLVKTELEPYTEILWKFGLKEIYIKHFFDFQKQNSSIGNEINLKTLSKTFLDYIDHIVKHKPNHFLIDNDSGINIDLTYTIKKNEELELTELLIFLLEEKQNGITLDFKSKITNNKFNCKSDLLLDPIINNIINEYKKRNYNEANLSYEEAEWELNTFPDLQWIRDYFKRFPTIIQTDYDNDMYYMEGYENPINIHDTHNYIEAYMIEDYANDHYTNADITLQFLKDKHKALKARTKVGAKPKNDYIASMTERLSYLIRLDRFFQQDIHKDISKFPISNKDYRLIHDYLVFWQFIEDKRETKNSTTPENYIKSLINNYRKHRKLVTENNMVHMLINSNKYKGVYPIK